MVLDVNSQSPWRLGGASTRVCDPRRAATFMQVGPGRYRWEFCLREDEAREDLTDSGYWRAGWCGPGCRSRLDVDDLDVIRTAEYVFKARIAERWREGQCSCSGMPLI